MEERRALINYLDHFLYYMEKCMANIEALSVMALSRLITCTLTAAARARFVYDRRLTDAVMLLSPASQHQAEMSWLYL